jgi:hypothetical protein
MLPSSASATTSSNWRVFRRLRFPHGLASVIVRVYIDIGIDIVIA